jgi:hypothetical protein
MRLGDRCGSTSAFHRLGATHHDRAQRTAAGKAMPQPRKPGWYRSSTGVSAVRRCRQRRGAPANARKRRGGSDLAAVPRRARFSAVRRAARREAGMPTAATSPRRSLTGGQVALNQAGLCEESLQNPSDRTTTTRAIVLNNLISRDPRGAPWARTRTCRKGRTTPSRRRLRARRLALRHVEYHLHDDTAPCIPSSGCNGVRSLRADTARIIHASPITVPTMGHPYLVSTGWVGINTGCRSRFDQRRVDRERRAGLFERA